MTPEETLIIQTAKVSDTVLSATESVIKYLEGHTSKTEVVNQLESIHTPDVKFVVEALQVLDETLKTHENTDLSEITGVMRELLSEARQIPKTVPEGTDYTEQLKGLLAAVQAVERVVKAQKLVAEAPVVNVPETNVHVTPPDLEPLQNGFKDVVKAVQKIVIPEYKTDNAGVEKLLKDANKLLDKILKKPVSGGGGGGGSSWPAVGTNNLPSPLKVDASGNLLVSDGAESTANAIAQAVYDALTRLQPLQHDIPYARDINDQMRVNVASGSITANGITWGNNGAEPTYYATGGPNSIDAREQLEEQALLNFNHVRTQRWTF